MALDYIPRPLSVLSPPEKPNAINHKSPPWQISEWTDKREETCCSVALSLDPKINQKINRPPSD